MEPDFSGLDFNAIMKQAKEVQDKIQQAKKDIDNTTVVGKAGAGMAGVEMTGKYDIISLPSVPQPIKVERKW